MAADGEVSALYRRLELLTLKALIQRMEEAAAPPRRGKKRNPMKAAELAQAVGLLRAGQVPKDSARSGKGGPATGLELERLSPEQRAVYLQHLAEAQARLDREEATTLAARGGKRTKS